MLGINRQTIVLDFEDSKSLNQQITWSELSEAFITHFRHPNARIVWLDKIKTLKMDSHGVQRYTDQFIRLAKHLGWNLRSDEAVYQYKQGLPSWLLDSLISAEMALIGKDSNIPGVETLGKMALGIEANSRKKDYTSNHQFNKIGASNLSQKKKNYYSIQCGFCGRFGHEEIECKTKQRKEQFSSTLQPTTKSIIQETTTTNNTNSKSYAQKIICNICGKEGHYATECSERKKKIRTVEINNNGELTINEESSDNSILIPCTINGKRIFGLLDTGANLSIININLVNEMGLTIQPRKGTISQAISGEVKPRLGIVENLELKAGKTSVIANFDVADLSDDLELIIGMNLFNKLGFQLSNIPFTWPDTISTKNKTKLEIFNEDLVKPPPNVGQDGIADEWRQIIEENIRLPANSVCKLKDSIVSINTGNAKPCWIRQYPIPQAFMDKVKERIELWKKNEWITDAPQDCKWNSPILVAAKPLSEIPNELSSEGGKQEENEEKNQKSYIVENIIAHELIGSKGYRYLVKWKNYPKSANSWVWAKDFDSLTPINKYWKKKKKQKLISNEETTIKKKQPKRRQLKSSQFSDFQSRRKPCDDIQHIYAINLGSTSNKKSNGRSQCYSTGNDSQTISQNVIFHHPEFPRRNDNN